jgi:hypothetical protein
VQQARDSPAAEFVFISAAIGACEGSKTVMLENVHFWTEVYKWHGVQQASVVFCMY